MKVGRYWAGGMLLAGLLSLSGCVQMPTFEGGQSIGQSPTKASTQVPSPPPMPPSYAGIKAMLDYGGEITTLPSKGQQAACEQAKERFTAHPSEHARVTLALLGTVVPDCLSPVQLQNVLQPVVNNRASPFRGLAMLMLNVVQQRKASAQALEASRQEAAGLHKKLKALTRIETQLNQVKDRELQNFN